jgi:hypothetical protein
MHVYLCTGEMKLLVSGLVAAADKRHVSCHRCDAHAIMLAGGQSLTFNFYTPHTHGRSGARV